MTGRCLPPRCLPHGETADGGAAIRRLWCVITLRDGAPPSMDLRAAGRPVGEIGQLLSNGKPVSRQTVYRALGMLAT